MKRENFMFFIDFKRRAYQHFDQENSLTIYVCGLLVRPDNKWSQLQSPSLHMFVAPSSRVSYGCQSCPQPRRISITQLDQLRESDLASIQVTKGAAQLDRASRIPCCQGTQLKFSGSWHSSKKCEMLRAFRLAEHTGILHAESPQSYFAHGYEHAGGSNSRFRLDDRFISLPPNSMLVCRHSDCNHHRYEGADRLHPPRPLRLGHARPPSLMPEKAVFGRGGRRHGGDCAGKLGWLWIHRAGIVLGRHCPGRRAHRPAFFKRLALSQEELV